MDKKHPEYRTKETPHHTKETACFDAYVNYGTALINYICRVACRFLGSIRDKKLFILLEFKLRYRCDNSGIGIHKKTLQFDKNTFMPTRMKSDKYQIDKID